MSKTPLFDGKNQLTKISIICMFKNNEEYLKRFFFNIVKELEDTYDVSFDYYVIENNSKDNSRELLKDFFKKKSTKSKLLLFNMNTDFFVGGNGKQYERIKNITNIRNKLINSITPLNSDWCLFIDSNIFFKKEILADMFKCEPSNNNIGMITPYTQQLFIPEVHGSYIPNLKQPSLLNHYYDTFSLYDKENKNFWPYCPFQKCKTCKSKEFKNRITIPETDSIIDVNSCFGGFALIKTEIINNKLIRWDTMSHNVLTDESICEHFFFCYLLKKMTNYRIVLLQDVDTIYRTF